MKGLADDVGRLSGAGGPPDMSSFPTTFPHLFKNFNRTWGAMLDDRVKDPKLKAVISGLWGYFGLPPSKLSPFYYAMPLMGYLEGGGYYPVGTSQKISDAFVGLIRKHGGEVKLNAKVERILVRDHAATGVRTADGAEYRARAVVSNANAFDTFGRMMPDEKEFLEDLTARMEKYSVSFSTLLVWLGLKTDLVRKAKLEESEIFYHAGLRRRGRVPGGPRGRSSGRSRLRPDGLRQPLSGRLAQGQEHPQHHRHAGLRLLEEIRDRLFLRQQGRLQ